MKLELLVDAKAQLGEGPSWHAEEQRLYWVDILGKTLHCYDPATEADQTWSLPEEAGCVVPRKAGGFVLALTSGLAFFDPHTGTVDMICTIEKEYDDMRFNDGKCDPAGRFWAGTIHGKLREPVSKLYCLDTDLTLRTMETNITTSNGLAWNSEATIMYYIDTPTQQVVAYDYDIDTGAIYGKRTVIAVPSGMGRPDGMTIDQEGMLWIAMWDGWKVTRWNPVTGTLLETWDMPAKNTTSCCFGGPTLRDLYITTARTGNAEEELESQPAAGGLFKLQTDVQGRQTFTFEG